MGNGLLFRCAAILAVAASTAVLGGCGSGGETTTVTSAAPASTESTSSAVVSEQQIQEYDPGTPQRTALDWWRAAQLNDPAHARTLYVEPPTLPNLAGQFNFVAGQLNGTIKVASVRPKGKRAVVVIDWERPGVPPHQVTLPMERKNGEWKIAGTLFLDLMVQQMQRSGATPPSSG